MILSLGADIKSRYCIYKEGRINLSKEFGDLSNLDNLNRFRREVSKLNPDILTFDMHPGYFSAQIAESITAKKKIAVQHHHAHIASQLFNKKINKPVIGIALDGTGYGLDGNLWGGEFLLLKGSKFERIAHFKYLPMPGGESVIKEPWKMAFSLLYDCFGEKTLKLKVDTLKVCPKSYYNVLAKMIEKKINSPLTSSAGRLFDAVSSILGVCHIARFEAEAAIKLDKLASLSDVRDSYKFDILREDNSYIIGYNTLIKSILSDLNKRILKQDIARKFHNALAGLIVEFVAKISKKHKTKSVVLSGGVFQNKLLFELVTKELEARKYELINDRSTPVNDLSICIGQTQVVLNSFNLKLKT